MKMIENLKAADKYQAVPLICMTLKRITSFFFIEPKLLMDQKGLDSRRRTRDSLLHVDYFRGWRNLPSGITRRVGNYMLLLGSRYFRSITLVASAQ